MEPVIHSMFDDEPDTQKLIYAIGLVTYLHASGRSRDAPNW